MQAERRLTVRVSRLEALLTLLLRECDLFLFCCLALPVWAIIWFTMASTARKIHAQLVCLTAALFLLDPRTHHY